LKAVYHILVSSAETIGAFNSGFDTVNLHRPTGVNQHEVAEGVTGSAAAQRLLLDVAAQVEIESNV
jgi:hypothetical protein